MANVTFNPAGTTAIIDFNSPGQNPIDQLVLRINYPVVIQAPALLAPISEAAQEIATPAPAAPAIVVAADPASQPVPPSLTGRIARGLYNHSGKIGMIASAMIMVSQTQQGGKAFADLGTGIANLAAQNYETVKNALVTTAVFAKDHLSEINTGLSAMWAVPAAMRAGSRK